MVKSLSRVEWLKSLLSPNWTTWQNQRLENGSGAIKIFALQHSDLITRTYLYKYSQTSKISKIRRFDHFTVLFQIFLFFIFAFIYTSRMPSVHLFDYCRTWPCSQSWCFLLKWFIEIFSFYFGGDEIELTKCILNTSVFSVHDSQGSRIVLPF